MSAIGVGYSGRAALRRGQCGMYAREVDVTRLRKRGATRKRLATTITGQSFLWGQVPGYKPPREVVIKRDRN
jgi:hypothetical protein